MYDNNKMVKAIGQTVIEINGMKEGSEAVEIVTREGGRLTLRYEQDCCASCSICQIDGDPLDLLGLPLLMCEEVAGESLGVDDTKGENGQPESDWNSDSFTWTFVKLATTAGYVTLRWYGSSNGYYSEAPTVYYEGPGAEKYDGRPEWR